MAQSKTKMLWENIHRGDLSAVHGLLQNGDINLEERDDTGRTFLMVACDKGDVSIVRELLEVEIDPNAVDSEKSSALLCAANKGHLEIVIELLEHDADLEHKDMFGWTALMWGSYKGRIMVVQELLDRGTSVSTKADYHMTPLTWAAGRGHTEIVGLLVDKGAKVNTADKYGTTPLIWACRKGYTDIVGMLLGEGANADASGMNSWTPLLVATHGGHGDVVHSLLQHELNVNATDKDGQTALAIAAREGHVRIVQDLLTKGAYVNVGDRSKDSILIHAVKGGQADVVCALLDKYVDVDVQGAEEKTAVYWAVEKGYTNIVRLLLASEPDLELCNKDGDTVLLRAVRSRNEECVQCLLEKGAKVSASNKRGDTALHIAIRARSKRITELLLRNPGNSRLLYRPNKFGDTPYSMDMYHQRGILQGIHGQRNLNAADAENLLGYEIYSSALADILSDPSLSTPITVGLYAKWGSGKSFLLGKLQSEMELFTRQRPEDHFSITPVVVLLSLFVSMVIGEAVSLSLSLAVGLAIGATVFVLQVAFFGVVVLCDRRYNVKPAAAISTVLAQRLRQIMLFLFMLFCNPRFSHKFGCSASRPYSVRFLFSECTRLTSVGGVKVLAAMIATLCQAVEAEYGLFLTRLFRVFRPTTRSVHQERSRFKLFCCVPSIVLFVLVLVCAAVGVAILVTFDIRTSMAVDTVLVAIACVLSFAIVVNFYTWTQSVMAVVLSQKDRVMKAAGQVDSLKMDGFLQCLKQEVELMTQMLTCMDSFMCEQTRLVAIADGLDSCEQSMVLQLLDMVKSLFCNDHSPFITILAVDPHIIIKGIEQNLKTVFQDPNINGFDYLHNVVQLPFYLQSQGAHFQQRHVASVQQSQEAHVQQSQEAHVQQSQEAHVQQSQEAHVQQSQEAHVQQHLAFSEDPSAPRLYARECRVSRGSVDEGRGRRRVFGEGLAGSQRLYMSSNQDLSSTFACNDYFSDFNPRSLRRLMNLVSVSGRLLRAYNVDFTWYRLAAWINMVEQWPYRVSWIIYEYEELESVDSGTTLLSLYQKVLPQIPVARELEPLLEIDRNVRKLEALLSGPSPGQPILTVGDLRTFLPCTINLDPYLRKLIREGRHQQEMTTYSGLCPIGPTLSSVTLQTSSAVVSRMLPRDNVHQPRLPHLTAAGTGSGKLILPRKPSVAYGLSSPHRTRGQLSGVPLVNGEVGMSAGRSVAAADRQVSNVPSCPHPSLFFKTVEALHRWEELDVGGVCRLLFQLKGLPTDGELMEAYARRVRDNNVTGLVLRCCSLDELGSVIRMRFGDWQLFRSAVLSLRHWTLPLGEGVLADASSRPPSYGLSDADVFLPPTVTIPDMSVTGKSVAVKCAEKFSVGCESPVFDNRGKESDWLGVAEQEKCCMSRDDSVVQQMMYEDSILCEALEDFSKNPSEIMDGVGRRLECQAVGGSVVSERRATVCMEDGTLMGSLFKHVSPLMSWRTPGFPHLLSTNEPPASRVTSSRPTFSLGGSELSSPADVAVFFTESERPCQPVPGLPAAGNSALALPTVTGCGDVPNIGLPFQRLPV